MRKNILLVSFVSAFLLTQTACEDGKDEFLDDFSTILYFRNSGEIPVSVYNRGRCQLPGCDKQGRLRTQRSDGSKYRNDG